ncbi:hypothetical protein GRJ2_001461900 [Grus japonensis]|uniref:Uncharacterized protein n=1 Tax=Grus japonensis TaxID=30415 RepID=A0ABC9WXQ4_GRUJA
MAFVGSIGFTVADKIKGLANLSVLVSHSFNGAIGHSVILKALSKLLQCFFTPVFMVRHGYTGHRRLLPVTKETLHIGNYRRSI